MAQRPPKVPLNDPRFEGMKDRLNAELPHLLNLVGAIVARPFEFRWDSSVGTASTDCKAVINVSPHFFLSDELREVGIGTVVHETGHIVHSPYGVELLTRANKEGGPLLQSLANIILDRKDDMLSIAHAPGYAKELRGRLPTISTMALVGEYPELFSDEGKALGGVRAIKPRDCWQDFFFAAKWHRSPRFKATAKAMKLVQRKKLLAASADDLLEITKRVRKLLGEPKPEEEKEFLTLEELLSHIEHGGGKTGLYAQLAWQVVLTQFVAAQRVSGRQELLLRLKQKQGVLPGSISSGRQPIVPLQKVEPNAKNEAEYAKVLAPVKNAAEELQRAIKKIDSPAEYTIFGQDEGELDFCESARIATGLSGFHMETVVEREIDAEIHLAIDASGSMTGEKLQQAKQIAALFTEGMLARSSELSGRIWGFNSVAVSDFGPVSRSSGFVKLESDGGNSDTHLLHYAGQVLARSQKRCKILLVLCDDGPDHAHTVRTISQQLMSRGIIVVHLLFGVHGAPHIYPIELLYTSAHECVAEFGELLTDIVKNVH